MNKRIIPMILTLMLLLTVLVQLSHGSPTTEVFSKSIVKYGATGSDVYELQGRLKYLGFYHGKIDGDFGYNTLKSVKYFQYRFGLKTDGVVGPKTKLKLWRSTKKWKPSTNYRSASSNNPTKISPTSYHGLSKNDLKLVANAVYGESRGEPYIGQIAVAAVILNRIKSSSFPNTISGVIFQPGAFTAVADGQIWLTPNATSEKAVRDAVNGMDPTSGSIYYFNPATATSKWIWSRPQIKRIGNHIFCK